MGMFDSIRFEDISMLPPPPRGFDLSLANLDLQTKSLDNCLNLYTISKEKKLYKENNFKEYSKEDKKELVDFHGIIKFGAYESTDLVDYSLEYEAKFTDGILQKIDLVSYRTFYHESKKEQREKYIKKYHKEKNKINKKIISFLQNVLIIYPFRLIGINFSSNMTGVFRSKNHMLCFYVPKLIFIYQKQKSTGISYGISLDKITTEFCLNKNFSINFSFKILGFGFTITKFKDFDFLDTYS